MNFMSQSLFFFLAILIVTLLAACVNKTVPELDSRPNIIFILTDDMGYSDVSVYGAKTVKTPNIDQLAAEGVRFTHFHTGSSICSPSRAAFLTGAYPQRSGLYSGINKNREAHWFLGLHPDEITIAEQLKEQGYATHMVGKWHLGHEPEFLPRKQGFETYYGMPHNYGHSREFYDGDELIYTETPLDQLTKLYTVRVNEIIREQADKAEPFFLYYAHNYPHTPFQASEDFVGSSSGGARGDMMQELDWGVGQLMDALKEEGIADNTIVIFTSDNGSTSNEFAQPYRGTKYVTFEGGHRVPFIFHWPEKITQASVSDAHVTAMDLFPTLAEVTGSHLPSDRIYDGESILPLFQGGTLKREAGDDLFYYYNGENLQAIRQGDWKLHLPRTEQQVPFWYGNRDFKNLDEPVLYNLERDPSETTDVAKENPQIVSQILAIAERTREQFGEYMQRGSEQRATGSLFPEVPVIGHQRDWHTLSTDITEEIKTEWFRLHPENPRRQLAD